MDVKTIAKTVSSICVKNGPSILTGFGVAFFLGATVAAAVVSPKVVKRVKAAKEQKKKNLQNEQDDILEEDEEQDAKEERIYRDVYEGMTMKQAGEKYELTPAEVRDIYRAKKKAHKARGKKPGDLTVWEKIKIAAPLYSPAALMIVCGLICVVMANKLHIDRTMAAVAACELSGNALKEYQDKTAEKFGEKADKEIKEEVAKDQIRKNPPESNTVIFTGNGEYLCYEPISRQYIRSSSTAVKEAIFKIRDALADDGWCSVNDYLGWLNAEEMPYGDDIGWSAYEPWETKVEDNFIYDRAKPDDDTPCLIIQLYPQPKHRNEGKR